MIESKLLSRQIVFGSTLFKGNIQILLLAIGLFISIQANAAIDLSSASSNWDTIMKGNSFDPGQDTQANSAVDLTGFGSTPLFYMKYDDNGTVGNTADDTIGFRFRSDNAADNQNKFAGYVWIGVDVDRDNDIDAFIMVIGKNQVNSLKVYDSGTGSNTSPSTTDIANTGTDVATNFTSSFDTTDSIDGDGGDADSDGDTDYFISVSVNFNALAAALNSKKLTGTNDLIGTIDGNAGVTKDTQMQFVIASAQNDNALNGDIGGYNDKTDDLTVTYADKGAFSSDLSFEGGISDSTAPTIQSTSPADDAANIGIASNITITFDEEVKFGSGNIVLYDSSDNTIETFNVGTGNGDNGGTITVSNDTVTINPGANLNNSTGYYVQISATAISDTGNNNFAGINDKTTLNFTTAAPGNSPPVITEGASTNVTMSEDGSPTAFNLTLNATDADGNTITWSIGTNGNNGTASASGSGTSKAISYTPNANFNGNDSFVVHISDSNGGTDDITVNVTINPVNDAPVITQGASTNVTMSEDGSPTAFNLTLNATDVDGDTITWSIGTNGNKGTASASSSGISKAISYTPNANFNGNDSFVVHISDSKGGTDDITVNVTITPVNDSPVNTAAPTINGTLRAGQILTANAGNWNDDLDGGSIAGYTYQWRKADDNAGSNAANIPGATNSTYTLTASDIDQFISVRITARDNGTPLPASSTTVSSAWNGPVDKQPNSLPVITEGNTINLTISEDNTPNAFNLTLNASDADNDTLSWSITSNGTKGTAITSGTGTSKTIYYTPTSNTNGNDSFVVQVSDGNGGTDTITVNIIITPVNDPPAFTSTPLLTVNEDEPYAYKVTANDIDNLPSELSFTVEQGPSWLKLLDNNDGTAQFSGTPDNDHVGSHKVTLKITDPHGSSEAQDFTVTVTPVNDAPIFTSSPILEVKTNNSYSYSITTADIDDRPENLTISSSNIPSWLTLTDNGDSTALLTGTPTTPSNTEVTLTVKDSSNASSTQTFTISVTPGIIAKVDLFMAVSPVDSGQVTPVIESIHKVAVGKEIELTATANEGYVFSGWTASNKTSIFANSMSASTTVILQKGTIITANFADINKTVTLTVNIKKLNQDGTPSQTKTDTSSSLTVEPSEGSHTRPLSCMLPITATSADDYQFVKWELEGTAEISDFYLASTSIIINGDSTLTAVFAPKASTTSLNVQVASNGGGQASTPGLSNAIPGETRLISAYPYEGYIFTGWTLTGDAVIASPSSSETTITVNGDSQATANFVKVTCSSSAGKLRLKVNTAKIERDTIKLNKIPLSIRTFDPVNDNIRVYIDGYTYEVNKDLGEFKTLARNRAYKYTSYDKTIKMLLNIKHGYWNFRKIKTSLNKINNLDGVPIILYINDTVYAMDYAMDEKVNWKFNSRKNTQENKELNNNKFSKFNVVRANGAYNNLRENRDRLIISKAELQYDNPDTLSDSTVIGLYFDEYKVQVPLKDFILKNSCYSYNNKQGGISLYLDFEKNRWSAKLRKTGIWGKVNPNDGFTLYLMIGDSIGSQLDVHRRSTFKYLPRKQRFTEVE